MPANSYAVRITHPAEIVKRICSTWALRCKRMVAYQHDDDGANNIHCHLIIEEADISKKQLRNLVKDSFDVKGPKMSFRGEYDGDLRGFSYLTKGKYDPIYVMGWTSVACNAWKEAWVPPTEYIRQDYWRKCYDKFNKEITISEVPNYTTKMKSWLSSGALAPPARYEPGDINRQVAAYVLKSHQGLWTPKAAKDFQFLRDQVYLEKGLGFPTRHFIH